MFNLVHDRWIIADGREYGIEELLATAHQLHSISGDNPLTPLPVLRLLAAIVRRAYDIRDRESWRLLFQRGQFQANPYLRNWQHKFNLNDPVEPFCQITPAQCTANKSSIVKLIYYSVKGKTPPFLDDTEARVRSLSMPELARHLLVELAFGTPKTVGGKERPVVQALLYGSPMKNPVVMALRGQDLFQTIMYNIIPSQHLPSWENPATEDPYTAYNRRVAVWYEGDRAVGCAITNGGPVMMLDDPMVVRIRHKGKDGMPLTWGLSRPVWRDATALLNRRVARHRLRDFHTLQGSVSADLYGVVADKAKVLAWKHELILLPPEYANVCGNELVALRTILDIVEACYGSVERGISSARIQLQRDKLYYNIDVDFAPYWSELDRCISGMLIQDVGRLCRDAIPKWRRVVVNITDRFVDGIVRNMSGSGVGLMAGAALGSQYRSSLRSRLGRGKYGIL